MKIIKFLLVFVLFLLLLGCQTPFPSGKSSSSFSGNAESSSFSSPFTTSSFSAPSSSGEVPSPAPLPSVETSSPEFPTAISPLPSGLEPREIDRGAPGKMRIALTFDAGAGRGYIDQILKTLVQDETPATFFLTGTWVEDNPEDVKRISQLGFRIGNHTQNHPYLTQLSDEEIKNELNSLEERIVELTGKSTKPLFRPPYGDRDERVLEVAASQGYWSIYWTCDSLDWEEGHDPEWVKTRILSRIEDGAIILCHVASPYTYIILDELIQNIREKGYTFVSIEEFLK